jgi:uncharacterized protein (DUF1697 family)
MPRYIGLLRGVNVGGHAKLPMKKLQELIESLGHTEVQTVIQSGNVVFSSPRKVTSTSIESALERELGLTVSVLLRTSAELERIVARNPFPAADTSLLHVGFMSRKPPAAAVRELDSARFAPEEVAVKGLEMYFHLPNGMGRAKLPPYIDRRLGVPTTVRNWRTVTKLLEIAQGS